MRTVIQEVKVFQFSELSEEAQEGAIQKYYELFGYNWASDAIASLKALAERFGGKLANYDLDWQGAGRATFSMPDSDEMDSGEISNRLYQLGTFNAATGKGNGDCKLTGYCADEDAIDGFRAAFTAGETDLQVLMQSAFKSWFNACKADCEDQLSPETFG